MIGKTYIYIDGANVRIGYCYDYAPEPFGYCSLNEKGMEFEAFASDLTPYTYANLQAAYEKAKENLRLSALSHFRDFPGETDRDDRIAGEAARMEVTGKEYAVVQIVNQPVGAQTEVA